MNEKEKILKYLVGRGQTITFAESCTGGLLCASLVDLPSASSVLAESYVTYANESKIALLGVREETLARFGAVSEQTAREMAEGAARRANAAVAVAVSGIAGPTGDTPDKPIGTVCFGFFVEGEVFTVTARFGNLGRHAVRSSAVAYAWQTLGELLKI